MSIRKIVPLEQAEWRIEPAPAWLEPREPDWEFAPPEGHGVAYLLIDEQHDVATQAISARTVRRLLTHGAVQALGQVQLDFDPAAHVLVIHELAIWRRDPASGWQKRSVAHRETFLLRQREQQLEQQILNGRVSLVALLEDLRLGDAVDVAWSLEPRGALPGLRFAAFFAAAWAVPVARAYFSLRLDTAKTVKWRVHLPASLEKPVEQVTEDRVTWSSNRPAPFVAEPNTPGWSWLFPLIDVSGWADWQEVANFVSQLWADALADGAAAITAEAAQLRRGREPNGAALAAIRFVQEEIRYLSVDFGHGAGMLPNGAGVVLSRRFGDCKDKAVLLTGLLRALGFEAFPMLVSSNWRHAVVRVQPSPAAFTHAIVTFVSDGRRYFVDPTLLGQGGDLAHLAPPPYQIGLEIRAGVTGLLEIPAAVSAEITLIETFHLDRKHRRGHVEQVLHAQGPLADDVRAVLIRQGRSAFSKQRVETLQKHFPALIPNEAGATVEDNLTSNIIIWRAQHDLPTWGRADEKPPAKFTYGAHGLFLAVESVGGPEKRREPWSLRFPMRVQHHVIVRGRDVRKVKAETHRFNAPGFKYTCDVAAKRHKISFDYRWETTQSEVLPEEWPAYCRERTRALAFAGVNLRTPSFWSYEGINGRTSGGHRKLLSAGLLLWLLIGAIGAFVKPSTTPITATQQPIVRHRHVATESAHVDNASPPPTSREPAKPASEPGVQLHLSRAEAALRRGDVVQAQEALDAADKIDGNNPAVGVLRALLLEKTDKFMEAEQVLERTLARAPNYPTALFAYGRITQRLGEPEKARAAWEKFLAQSPAHPDALLAYALLLWNGNERERADALITDAVRSQPVSNAALETALAAYFSATDRPRNGLDSAKRAVELAPNEPQFAYVYTMMLIRAGLGREAVESARQLEARFPGHPFAARAVAISAANAGDTVTAERVFKYWIKAMPRDPYWRATYGYFLARCGRTGEARALLEQATREFPGAGLAWLNYAAVLNANGEREAGAAAQRKANALIPPTEQAMLVR
jgi:tetratricopeptide (TPR) repeat protein